MKHAVLTCATTLLVALLLLVGMPASSRAAQAPRLEKPPLSERWFGIYVDNERVGFYRQRITETNEGYRMEGSSSVRLRVMGFSKEATSHEVYQVGKRLNLRSFQIEQSINGAFSRLTGAAGSSILRVRIENNSRVKERMYRFRGEVYPGPALNLHPLMTGATVGKSYKILTFDPEEVKIKEVKITLLGEEQTPDGQPALKLRNNLYPFVDNDIWVDHQGSTLLESVRDGLVLTRAEESGALGPFVSMLAINRKETIHDFSLVRAEPPLREQAKLTGLTLEIDGWNDSLPLQQDGGQTMEKGGEGRVVVRTGSALPSIPPLLAGVVADSPRPPEKYLKPDEKIESEAPEIQVQSRNLAPGKQDQREIARALAAWTADWLKDSEDGEGALASLTSRSGNCQTHALLYTALARAAGIPTRFVSGLVALEGKGFFYHSWAESWLNGRWVGVDPFYNQLPADPTHIKLLEGHTPKELAPLITIIGRIDIKVLDAKY